MHVLRRQLRDGRAALVGWSLAFLAFAFFLAAFYPSIHDQAAILQKALEGYPPALRAVYGNNFDFTTGQGYVRAEFFSLMLPLMLAIYGIARGADTLAGDEERGGLDIVLSLPLTRRRVLAEKTLSVGLAMAWLVALVGLALLAADVVVALGLDLAWLARGLVDALLLGAALGAAGLAAAAWTGRKGLAIGVASGIAVLSYLLDILSKLSPQLVRMADVSLFHYYAGGEASATGFAVLLAAVIALGALTFVGFERRDLRT